MAAMEGDLLDRVAAAAQAADDRSTGSPTRGIDAPLEDPGTDGPGSIPPDEDWGRGSGTPG
jgi:hypothetical protein